MALFLDLAAISEYTRSPGSVVDRHVQDLAARLARSAKTKVRRLGVVRGDTATSRPHLADSIEVIPEGQVNAERSYLVGSRLPHARPHHEGAQPHIIRANRARALSFFWSKVNARTVVPRRTTTTGFRGGVFVIGRGFVNHPGHAANPYLIDAMEEVIR